MNRDSAQRTSAASTQRTGASDRTRSVLRGASIVLVITIAARIAGFVRYLVFGASVGAGDVGTAYASANLLPTVLFEVVAGGALAAVVVPLVAGLVPEGENGTQPSATPGADEPLVQLPEDSGLELPAQPDVRESGTADAVMSALVCWVLLATVPLAIAIAVFAHPLAQLLLGTDSAGLAVVTLDTDLLRIFAVQLPLYGLAILFGAYLQARRRFAWPALMPLVSSLVVMAAYRVYAAQVPVVATAATIPRSAVLWLGWGTTAGVAAMAVPVLISSLRLGLRLRPALRMPDGYGVRARSLAGAGLGAVVAQQGVMALILLLSMRAGGTGTLPVFQYAQALYLLPYAVLVVPLLTSVFPHLSELRLVGDSVAFARMAAASLRMVIVVAVIGSSALFAAGPALEQFFRGVDRAGATGVGSATAALALGLAGYAVMMQASRILSAALQAKDALVVGSAGWLIAAVLVLVMGLPAPDRTAAEAATAFGLAIACGMGLGALVGLGRVSTLLAASDEPRAIRRTALFGPLGLFGGGIPGLLLVRWWTTTGTSEAGAVLAGVAGGACAGLIALLIMALADPSQVRHLVQRLRRRSSTPKPSSQTSASETSPSSSSSSPSSSSPAPSTSAEQTP